MTGRWRVWRDTHGELSPIPGWWVVTHPDGRPYGYYRYWPAAIDYAQRVAVDRVNRDLDEGWQL